MYGAGLFHSRGAEHRELKAPGSNDGKTAEAVSDPRQYLGAAPHRGPSMRGCQALCAGSGLLPCAPRAPVFGMLRILADSVCRCGVFPGYRCRLPVSR